MRHPHQQKLQEPSSSRLRNPLDRVSHRFTSDGTKVHRLTDGYSWAQVVVQANLNDIGVILSPAPLVRPDFRSEEVEESRLRVIWGLNLLNIEPSRVGQSPIVHRGSNVQFRVCHLKSHVCKHLGRLCQILGYGPSDKVALESDTVKRGSLIQERFGDLSVCLGFVVVGFNVEVVDV